MADEFYCSPITANLFQRICELMKGGVAQEIFAANLGEIANITYDAVTGEVDAITMKTNPVTTNPYYWYRIISKKQSAGWIATFKKGGNNSYIEQTLPFIVPGITTVNKKAFQAMASGQAVFIVKDSTGLSHIIGEVSGCEMQGDSTLSSGVALDDLAGMNVTFLANEVFVPRSIEAGTTIEVLGIDDATVETITFA